MDEWQARDGWVYGRDGEDSICKAMRRRDGGGTLIDEKVIAEQIAREHNALATARAHVEALVGNAWVGLAVREGGAALCHYCGVVANVVPPARVAEFPHAADCPVAAARRWLDALALGLAILRVADEMRDGLDAQEGEG